MIVINKRTKAIILFAFFLAASKEAWAKSDNTLTITHTAVMPDGSQQPLSVEVIENITDLYYYKPDQSPVASKLLKGGYSLNDEKNKLIEADVVGNGGAIDLKYTPSAQKVTVTYYEEKGNGTAQKTGTIEDRAYVGQKYIPALPEDESGGSYVIKESGDYMVKHGENDFSVVYEKKEDKKNNKVGQGEYSGNNGAVVINIAINRNSPYAYGYSDNTFRPDNKITKEELFSLLYNIAGGKENNYRDMVKADFLKAAGVIEAEDLAGAKEMVTWEDFYRYAAKLNSRLVKDSLTGIEKENWEKREDKHITRAQAVAAINAMINKKDITVTDNKFKDVYADHWGYFEILKAVS